MRRTMLTKSTVSVALTSLRVFFPLSVVVVILLLCGTAGMAKGRKYGLFVGINAYTGPGEQLFGAVNDATKLRGQMIKNFGFEEGDTKLLTDASATREAIVAGIRAYQQKAQAGDL